MLAGELLSGAVLETGVSHEGQGLAGDFNLSHFEALLFFGVFTAPF